jgi:hypothetical protein
MKNLLLLVAAWAACAAQAQQPVNVQDEDSKLAIKVTVNGKLVNFSGTTPMMAGSRILVPMRGVFEMLGAGVRWDGATRTVHASSGSTTIALALGKNEATVNGKTVTLDQPAMSVEGRTMVPLRFLSQALGAKVDWLAADRTVAIVTGSDE